MEHQDGGTSADLESETSLRKRVLIILSDIIQDVFVERRVTIPLSIPGRTWNCNVGVTSDDLQI